MKNRANKIDNLEEKNIIIVGAGPAGIGIACALEEIGITDYIILEKGNVGESFKNWPKETKLLTPSFTSNMFMQPDLNAVTPLTSPAYSYSTEHLTGSDYAKYLKDIVKHFKIKIEKNIEVVSIEKCSDQDKMFEIKTKENTTYKSKYVIWAAGEYFYPKKNSFDGSELCEYYSNIKSFKDLKINDMGQPVLVIGGYEAGMDIAYNLGKLNIKTQVLDTFDRLSLEIDDPSKSLSPYTIDRCAKYLNNNTITYKHSSKVNKIKLIGGEYIVLCENGTEYKSKNQPIFCGGFEGSVSLIKNLVDKKENGDLIINNYDESEKTKNLFFVGPSIHSQNIILCFIYKFRMRYATVAFEIANRCGLGHEERSKGFLEYYKKYNFYLEDIQSCGVNCIC